MDWARRLPIAAKVAATAWLAIVVVAGGLAVAGDGLAGLKVLRLPFVGGLVLFCIGAGLVLIGQARDFWRRRAYVGAVILVGFLLFVVVTFVVPTVR